MNNILHCSINKNRFTISLLAIIFFVWQLNGSTVTTSTSNSSQSSTTLVENQKNIYKRSQPSEEGWQLALGLDYKFKDKLVNFSNIHREMKNSEDLLRKKLKLPNDADNDNAKQQSNKKRNICLIRFSFIVIDNNGEYHVSDKAACYKDGISEKTLLEKHVFISGDKVNALISKNFLRTEGYLFAKPDQVKQARKNSKKFSGKEIPNEDEEDLNEDNEQAEANDYAEGEREDQSISNMAFIFPPGDCYGSDNFYYIAEDLCKLYQNHRLSKASRIHLAQEWQKLSNVSTENDNDANTIVSWYKLAHNTPMKPSDWDPQDVSVNDDEESGALAFQHGSDSEQKIRYYLNLICDRDIRFDTMNQIVEICKSLLDSLITYLFQKPRYAAKKIQDVLIPKLEEAKSEPPSNKRILPTAKNRTASVHPATQNQQSSAQSSGSSSQLQNANQNAGTPAEQNQQAQRQTPGRTNQSRLENQAKQLSANEQRHRLAKPLEVEITSISIDAQINDLNEILKACSFRTRERKKEKEQMVNIFQRIQGIWQKKAFASYNEIEDAISKLEEVKKDFDQQFIKEYIHEKKTVREYVQKDNLISDFELATSYACGNGSSIAGIVMHLHSTNDICFCCAPDFAQELTAVDGFVNFFKRIVAAKNTNKLVPTFSLVCSFDTARSYAAASRIPPVRAPYELIDPKANIDIKYYQHDLSKIITKRTVANNLVPARDDNALLLEPTSLSGVNKVTPSIPQRILSSIKRKFTKRTASNNLVTRDDVPLLGKTPLSGGNTDDDDNDDKPPLDQIPRRDSKKLLHR